MTRKDIVEMYKKGYSIDYIIKYYYTEKTKFDIPNHKFKNTFIITKKSCTMEGAKKEVENTIMEFAVSNKAN